MQGLTKRQAQTLDFIRQSIEERGYPPTLREIGESMGIRSTNGVNDHLRALERKGYLSREDMKSRALRLVSRESEATSTSDDSLLDVQVLGRVAAGLPLMAEENVIDTVRIDRMLVRGGRDVFGLRVQGDSMINAGILDGDFVVIRKTQTANSGEIVVALVMGEEATLKRLRRKGASVALEAANPAYETRIFGPDQVQVQGKLVGLIRRYH